MLAHFAARTGCGKPLSSPFKSGGRNKKDIRMDVLFVSPPAQLERATLQLAVPENLFGDVEVTSTFSTAARISARFIASRARIDSS